MTVRFISNSTMPHYTAVSTDVVNTSINTSGSVIDIYPSVAGIGLIGGTVYFVDTGAWAIIDSVANTLILRNFTFPNSSGSPAFPPPV